MSLSPSCSPAFVTLSHALPIGVNAQLHFCTGMVHCYPCQETYTIKNDMHHFAEVSVCKQVNSYGVLHEIISTELYAWMKKGTIGYMSLGILQTPVCFLFIFLLVQVEDVFKECPSSSLLLDTTLFCLIFSILRCPSLVIRTHHSLPTTSLLLLYFHFQSYCNIPNYNYFIDIFITGAQREGKTIFFSPLLLFYFNLIQSLSFLFNKCTLF